MAQAPETGQAGQEEELYACGALSVSCRATAEASCRRSTRARGRTFTEGIRTSSQAQDTLQAHIRRLESERAEAETRMAELRKTYQEEQDVRKTREAELIRLQRLTAALQEDLSTLRQEFSQTRTALSQARAEGQKWQVRYAEVVEAQKALQGKPAASHRRGQAETLEAQAASHPQAPAQERAEDIAALEQGLEQMRKTQQESLTLCRNSGKYKRTN